MTSSSVAIHAADSLWVRYWHAPVRGERLGLMRIFLATALLADQLIQFWPRIGELYGPEGVGPAGLHDAYQLQNWRLSYLFFNTDNLGIIYPVFWLWVAVTAGFLVGWHTRWMNVLCWLLTRCFHERNPGILYGGDSVLQIALFLLLLSPCGAALSLDARRKRRQGLLSGPAWVPPWSLRLIQIQLCLIYFSTGLIKLRGSNWGNFWWTSWPPQGSWWDGTAIHYFLNDTTMARWAYAEFPIPFWLTMPMTYVTVFWEVSYPLLVMIRWVRPVALIYGVMFHIGIALTVDIGWFSYYTLAFYAIWIPNAFWQRFDTPSSAKETIAQAAKDGEGKGEHRYRKTAEKNRIR